MIPTQSLRNPATFGGMVLILLVSILMPVRAVQAHSTTSAIPARTTVSMVLNCAGLSEKAHNYAVMHGICPSSQAANPDNTVEGNCGSAELEAANGTHGNADFTVRLMPNFGQIVEVQYDIDWINFQDGETDTYKWGPQITFTGGFANETAVYTGIGVVTGALYGSVWLSWGASCTLGSPPAEAGTMVTD